MPKTARVIPPRPELVRARSEGIQLISPLQSTVTTLVIKDADDYLDADGLLGRLNNAIAKWDAKIAPIRDPLKEALAKAKEAMEGVKALDGEVRGPLDQMVLHVKGSMRDFKLREARQIQEALVAQERETQRIRDEAARKALQAANAKTVQMKAKLEQARADLEAQANLVEEETAAITPVKGGASSTRTIKKVRIADVGAFLEAIKDYRPKAGIYEMGSPPLSVLTCKTDRSGQLLVSQDDSKGAFVDSAMGVAQIEISKIYSSQPGVVASWPGIQEFDDIVIASR